MPPCATSAGADAIALAPGRLYALAHPYELNGRVSTHDTQARGFAPMNSYLLIEGDSALLVDAGLSVHQDALIRQLEALLRPSSRLSILPTRIGEFAPVCNVRALVDHFDVIKLYGSQGDPATWVDFRPEDSPYGTPPRQGRMEHLGVGLVSGDGPVSVDPAGRRGLDVFLGPLRLLPVYWIYDASTRTLFTADVFTHVSREDARGPWITGDGDEPPPSSAVYRHMTRSRFWWLAGAETVSIAEDVAAVFDTHDVETIAPAFGCIIAGRDAVRRHHEQLQEILRIASSSPSIGIDAGRWTL